MSTDTWDVCKQNCVDRQCVCFSYDVDSSTDNCIISVQATGFQDSDTFDSFVIKTAVYEKVRGPGFSFFVNAISGFVSEWFLEYVLI